MTDINEVKNNPNYVKVLDKGFVGLIDHMGSDSDIAKSARVSYSNGTKTVRQDAGLIRYLVKHDHTSPIEMGEVKFHVKVPMFVARQWVSHRTACLSGDTRLSFSLVGDKPDSIGSHYYRSIKKIHDMWHGKIEQRSGNGKSWKSLGTEGIDPQKVYSPSQLGRISGKRAEYFRAAATSGILQHTRNYSATGNTPIIQITGQQYLDYIEYIKSEPIPTRKINPMINRIKNMNIRYMDESTGEVKNTHITNIWESGVKDVYEVILTSGNKIKMTRDHVCYTPDGWFPLEKIVDLETGIPNKKMCITKPKGSNSYYANDIDVDEDLEIWKDIKGYSGEYQVSNYGRVRSFKSKSWKIKKNVLGAGGRYVVSLPNLSNPSRSMAVHTHVLVMEAFKGDKPSNKDLIRHLNGNCLDNRIENLEYGTHKENSEDTILHNNTSRVRIEFVDVKSVKYVGTEMTYDLTVEDINHNFLAENIVVHNCMNEISARYSEMVDDFYIPELENLQPQSKVNNQGRNGNFTLEQAQKYRTMIEDSCRDSYNTYKELIKPIDEENEELGLARELSRMVLPVNLYTEFYWKQDLKNLLHLIKLRMDPHAQWEIQQYAQAMYELIQQIFPETIKAFDDYKRNTTTVTSYEKELLKEVLKVDGSNFDSKVENFIKLNHSSRKAFLEQWNISERELKEFKETWKDF